MGYFFIKGSAVAGFCVFSEEAIPFFYPEKSLEKNDLQSLRNPLLIKFREKNFAGKDFCFIFALRNGDNADFEA